MFEPQSRMALCALALVAAGGCAPMTVGSHEAPTQPLTDDRLLAIAETFEKQGNVAEAERTYRTVLARNPQAGVAQEQLARLSGSGNPPPDLPALARAELALQSTPQEPQHLQMPPPAPAVDDSPPVLPLTAAAAPAPSEKLQPADAQALTTVTVASQEEPPSTPQIELVQSPPSGGTPRPAAEKPEEVLPQGTPGWQSRRSGPKKLPEAPGAAASVQSNFGIVIRPAGN